jgi:bifunctional UDP-N-acetylglucosamine pyrophosphorylase/glucosamine-1-phosphate N-acetyltransferase
MRIQPIILAAGKGTRMENPDLPKVLVPLKGRPMMSYLLETVDKAGFLPPVLVVGYKQDLIRAEFGERYIYIEQKEQLGTGHAVMACREQLQGTADMYIIMFGDQPLWTVETMRKVEATFEETQADFAMATVVSDDPTFYNFGRIIRDGEGNVVAIREYKDCSDDEKRITEYNPSLYCCTDAWMWNALDKISTENVQHEYYLTDLLSIAIAGHAKISLLQAEHWQEALGINTVAQLQEVEKYL